MLFSDFPIFFIFLALVVFVLWLLRGSKAFHRWVLLGISFFFLATFSYQDLFLLLAIATLNYLFLAWATNGNLSNKIRSNISLIVIFDLLLLGYFKYFDFLVIQFFGPKGLNFLSPNHSLPVFSLEKYSPAPDYVWMPLALSFYIFSCIGYCVDVLKGKYPLCKYTEFLLYLSYFPHLISGPIVRGDQLVSQFRKGVANYKFNWIDGLYCLFLGYVFKAAVADQIAEVINPYWNLGRYGPQASMSLIETWVIAVLYSVQIFGDFAGYSLMAVGMGKLIGFELPENFRAPYIASTFQEFWRRWHITLSEFLRDYLYVDFLGGSRDGRWRTYFNLFLTMVLGGLWHGPSWNFVFWGAIHGGMLIVERELGVLSRLNSRFKFLWPFVVQVVVILAWVPFRSPGPEYTYYFYKAMFDINKIYRPNAQLYWALVLIVPIVIHHYWHFKIKTNPQIQLTLKQRALITGVALYYGLIAAVGAKGFIYFKF